VNPAITIVPASWDKDQERLRHIRYTVFVIEQKVDAREEWDGADVHCHHALALTADGQAIGTARLHPSGKIGRVAVLEPWRHRGIGRQLMDYLMQVAIRERMPRVYLHSQESAVPFYERLDFVCVGEPFTEANIPHRRMERVLIP
jgi:predicted GNAT family N-acyltransferase